MDAIFKENLVVGQIFKAFFFAEWVREQSGFPNFNDEKLEELVYWWFFGFYHMILIGQFEGQFFPYGCPWTFLEIITSFPSLITLFLC
jgi:hypothetical protein